MNNILGKEAYTTLLEKGNHVLSLCEDDNTTEDSIARKLFYELEIPSHYLPEQYKEDEAVVSALNELKKYASFICDMYDCGRKPVTEKVLPPWIVFPNLSATSLGWRMGLPETYLTVYDHMIREMSADEFKEYKAQYPAPQYMCIRARYIQKENLIKEEAV